MRRFFVPLLLILAVSWVSFALTRAQEKPAVTAATTDAASGGTEGLKVATFAGGCFWCMEYAFDKAPGVKKTVVGYTGGKTDNPDYDTISTGRTGHAEAIQVFYDPKQTNYEELLNVFWRNIDPTAKDRQFADRGTQYRTAIFFHDAEERRLAEATRDALAKSGKFSQPIVTEITAAGPFFVGEEYHQDYHLKKPERFHAYEEGSGRAPFLRRTWGDDQKK